MALFGRWGKETPAPAPIPLSTNNDVPFTERLNNAIDKLNVKVRLFGRELPTFVTSKVRTIEDRLQEILRSSTNNSLGFKSENDLMRVVESHITESIDIFLGVHPDDRTDDSEAVQKIIYQINKIDERIKEFEEFVRSGNRDKLTTQSSFLDMTLN